jgi:predicted secreted hydrolase
MSDSFRISRRAFASGVALLGLGPASALAQGFAGLGTDAEGFAAVVPGRSFAFPADHGPHPDFRIEWWYVTANLVDASGVAYGAQWTLFRQATKPRAQQEGWANQQIWMGHAAVTRADTHRYGEAFARGGVGQAGVEAKPFLAWIDFMGDARDRSDPRHHHRAARAQGVGHGFCLCAAPRCRTAAGAAG